VSDKEDGFLSRWARRKVQARQGLPVEPAPQGEPPEPQQSIPAAKEAVGAAPAAAGAAQMQPVAAPMPTLDDVAALGVDANYTRFVARGVDEDVKRAALKKLFAEPQFNVMDGLDIYIDDYGVPDPLPAGMLRKMNQAWDLGLFGAEERPGEGVLREASGAGAAQSSDNLPPADHPPPLFQDAPRLSAEPTDSACSTDLNTAPINEDPDLQLQPNHEAGRAGADESAEHDLRRVEPGA
jgi:hypothetical protein